ncbi:hypothetical protein F4809DRAFT_646279 [Biscogniauxia mediterranea]|nr:hypothetical protein F4809DRAFT_646279 [Biscogniauxia mediterranea]
MMCFHGRRLAMAVVQQRIAIPLPPPRASQLLLGSPSEVRARGLPSSKLSYAIHFTSAPRYSTSSASSDTTAASPAPSQTPSSAGPEKPDYFDDAESDIWDALVAEFSPTELTVQDISGGCGSMYGIEIASDKFRGVNMLKQQRMVNAVLGDHPFLLIPMDPSCMARLLDETVASTANSASEFELCERYLSSAVDSRSVDSTCGHGSETALIAPAVSSFVECLYIRPIMHWFCTIGHWSRTRPTQARTAISVEERGVYRSRTIRPLHPQQGAIHTIDWRTRD